MAVLWYNQNSSHNSSQKAKVSISFHSIEWSSDLSTLFICLMLRTEIIEHSQSWLCLWYSTLAPFIVCLTGMQYLFLNTWLMLSYLPWGCIGLDFVLCLFSFNQRTWLLLSRAVFLQIKYRLFHQKLCLASDLPVWLSGPETNYPMHLFFCMSTTKSLFLADDVGVTDHIGKKTCIPEYFCSSSKYIYFNLFPPPPWRARTWPLGILSSLFFTFIDKGGIPVWIT